MLKWKEVSRRKEMVVARNNTAIRPCIKEKVENSTIAHFMRITLCKYLN